MNEKPILFSGPMVNAILDGRKLQTRRVIKPQPIPNGFGKPGEDTGWEIPCHEGSYPPSAMLWPDERGGMLNGDAGHPWSGVDRLWVKETFSPDTDHNRIFYRADACDEGKEVPYLISGAGGFGGGVGHARIDKWKPSIFMPRRASRILLEITDVRAEPLQEITENDAISEGIDRFGETSWLGAPGTPPESDPRQAYRHLWDSINAKRGLGWNANPFVWAISFKRVP